MTDPDIPNRCWGCWRSSLGFQALSSFSLAGDVHGLREWAQKIYVRSLTSRVVILTLCSYHANSGCYKTICPNLRCSVFTLKLVFTFHRRMTSERDSPKWYCAMQFKRHNHYFAMHVLYMYIILTVLYQISSQYESLNNWKSFLYK